MLKGAAYVILGCLVTLIAAQAAFAAPTPTPLVAAARP